MDKIFVNVFVPSLDRSFNIELPINLEMSYVIEQIQKTICELSDGSYEIKQNVKLYDSSTGFLINPNNIVKFSGLKNGCRVMLI